MPDARDTEPVSYGGQAVIEGVMIRSRSYVSVACRLPQSDGAPGHDTPIDVHTEPIRSAFVKRPWLRKVPLIRGVVGLFEMLSIGLRALERSGNLQAAYLTVLSCVCPVFAVETPTNEKSDSAGALNGPLMLGALAGGLLIGAALFVFLPNWLADLIGRWLGQDGHLFKNIVEGVIRLVVFVGYVGLIGLLPDIRRVFMYHGAEHKVVNGFEAGREMRIDDVRDMSVIHPRCGTNFAFIVIVMSLIVFCFLPWAPSLLVRVGLRLLCLPLVAGLSFELIRLVGTHREVAWLQTLIWPGLAMQKITTREPEPHMLEVALASFNAVREAEETGVVRCEVRGEPAAESDASEEPAEPGDE